MPNATFSSEDTLQQALDSGLSAFFSDHGSALSNDSADDPRGGDQNTEACEGGGSDCYPSDENQGGLVGDVVEILVESVREVSEDDPRAGEGDNNPEACEGGGSDCYPSDENQGG